MDAALLDTDTLNEVLKGRNPTVVRHAADYLQQHGQFAISSITWYEVLRGLLEKNAAVQLAQFALSAAIRCYFRSPSTNWNARPICGRSAAAKAWRPRTPTSSSEQRPLSTVAR